MWGKEIAIDGIEPNSMLFASLFDLFSLSRKSRPGTSPASPQEKTIPLFHKKDVVVPVPRVNEGAGQIMVFQNNYAPEEPSAGRGDQVEEEM